MSDSPLASRRAQLETEQARVRSQLAKVGPGSALEFDDGFADSGQVTAERGEAEALAGTLLETLQDIDDALVKLEAGSYGRCEECGNEIAPARLEAMPAARLCITCASGRR
jgi:DnaK suppressor protein